MPITARYFVDNIVSDVVITTGGVPLPSGSAWVRAGIYINGGISWDMRQEGLYRFIDDSNGSCRNCIVIAQNGSIDIYKMMSAVSWNHVHGIDHNALSGQSLSNIGITKKWRCQCGVIANLMHWLCPQLAITSRIKSPQTLSNPNSWDSGHVVVETQHGSDWRMWDITNGKYFVDDNGIHLSTAAFIAQIANGGPFPATVRLDDTDKYNSQDAGVLDLGIYRDMYQRTPTDSDDWYRKTFQTA